MNLNAPKQRCVCGVLRSRVFTPIIQVKLRNFGNVNCGPEEMSVGAAVPWNVPLAVIKRSSVGRACKYVLASADGERARRRQHLSEMP